MKTVMEDSGHAPMVHDHPDPHPRRLVDAMLDDRRVLPWWIAGAAGFLAFLVVLDLADVVVSNLTRDPNGITGEPAHLGALSTLGLVGWGVAAAVCAVTALVLGSGPRSRYLWATAALLTLMLVDDGLLLHERVLPDGAGVPEPVVYLLYGGVGLVWLVVFRAEVLRVDTLLLVLAAASLACSVALDATDLVPLGLEDAPKFVGIGSLIAYSVREAQRRLRPALDE